MLLPEQAKLRLAEWQLPEDENRIAEGLKKLSAGLRKIAEPVFADPKDKHVRLGDDTEAEWDPREAAAQIDRLSVKDRAKIFAVVAPQMTPAMEATWQLLKTTTYQA